jgi:predicted flap endonuclease-1-like 5' DNA nuclease
MARRRLQSWLRRRLRGSARQQLTRLISSLRKRLAWSNLRVRLAALRKYFTQSYWRKWAAKRRDLATREGLQAFLVETYRSYRKRQWRGWLRGRLRGGVDTVSGGLVTTFISGWLAPLSGPVGTALSVVVAEIQRWIEDVVMGKFDALGKRYSTLVLRSGARITDATDRVWYFVTGETPPTVYPSVSSIAGEHAAALRDVGIKSVDQLAAADPDHLANAVAVGPAVIDEWIEQADRRGTKSDRPPIAETMNGRRVRQRVGRVTERVATVRTVVVTRLAEPAERGVRSLRTRTTLARTWVRDDALPAVIASAQRARTAVRRRTSERAARVRSTVSQLTTPINDQLGTADSGLRSIDGIGPAYSERLSEAGLTTVDEVARSDPERVAVSIGVSPKRVYRWTAQARSAEWVGQRLRREVAIRLVKAEVSVVALRDPDPAPLDPAVTSRAWGSLDAPSEAAMRRLSAVGIESIGQLAAADPDRLAAATNFDTERTAIWIRAARIYQKHIVAR